MAAQPGIQQSLRDKIYDEKDGPAAPLPVSKQPEYASFDKQRQQHAKTNQQRGAPRVGAGGKRLIRQIQRIEVIVVLKRLLQRAGKRFPAGADLQGISLPCLEAHPIKGKISLPRGAAGIGLHCAFVRHKRQGKIAGRVVDDNNYGGRLRRIGRGRDHQCRDDQGAKKYNKKQSTAEASHGRPPCQALYGCV